MVPRRLFFRFGIAAGVIAVFVSLSWAVVDTGIHATGDHEFCTSCHSHKPIGTSYREALHGGNNAAGWRASCSDCHISHANALAYLWVKGVHGVVDPTMELIKDPYDIDWHGRREHRERYVYDSGCLQCHKYLKDVSQANAKSFRPHRKYFSGTDKSLKCVSCHEHVGHANLGIHLQAHGWEKNDE